MTFRIANGGKLISSEVACGCPAVSFSMGAGGIGKDLKFSGKLMYYIHFRGGGMKSIVFRF